LVIRQSQFAANSGDTEATLALAACHVRIADALTDSKESTDALAEYEIALRLIEPIVKGDPSNIAAVQQFCTVLTSTADTLSSPEEEPRAIQLHARSLELRRVIARKLPDDEKAQRDLTVGMNRLADIYKTAGEIEKSLSTFEEVLNDRRQAYERLKTGRAQRDFAMSFHLLGNAQYESNRFQPALENFREGRRLAVVLFKDDPTDARGRRDLCMLEEDIGRALAAMGDLQGALAAHESALKIGEPLVAKNKTNASYRQTVAAQHMSIGCILIQLQDFDDARPHLDECITVFEELLTGSPTSGSLQALLAHAKSCRDQLASAQH
jgi:tetratricopeptide (TPR) repeat protein